ncbi:MAG: CoA pyrophosphatase, partial [Lentimicrobiaceae bacterium]|nr:CoA pyrophosphatase [Lentimicrobiaceae bacterium]
MHQMKQPEILSRFCSEFTGLLDHNLPGAEAHERLAPSNRSELLKLGKNGPAPQLSGVLILMYARREQINLVFIQRSIYKGIHSGQVSFPGGKADPQDRDLAQTALRETFEEVGVHPDSIDFI